MQKNSMTSGSSKHAVCVLIKIAVKKYKKEEFLECMQTCRAEILRQPGCLSYDIYLDSDEENTCRLVGEWETASALEKHFKTREYELLLGAAMVLGETFEMETSKVLHIGNLDWARKRIRSHKKT
jgi:quinol monooxygenase YgiN